jgi:XTP/dITP diphosphohydrolase
VNLCFATNNRHKIEEIASLINHVSLLSLTDIGCFEELEETQATLEGNSLQKAQYVFDNFGIAVFADDTGLEVDALGGEPGVHSARYAGEQRDNEANIELLLSKLKGESNRKAQFRTVITLIIEGKVTQFEGVAKGTIGDSRKGDGGFGYDAIFTPDNFDQTFAQMSIKEKNLISHRGLAVNKLVAYLNNQI